MHPPALLICAALGRLPNVEGVRPTRSSAYRLISAAGASYGIPALAVLSTP
jgi:hypothetical protein